MNKIENKDVVRYKDNFIIKFFKYIKNIFKKEEKIKIVEEQEKNKKQIYQNTLKDNTDFRDDITYRKSDEEIRILELQKQYKADNILEENMTEDDHAKLIELYK